MSTIHHHFSNIAGRYKDLRTTDPEPLEMVRDLFKGLREVRAADVGCGVGRYVIGLFEQLEERLHLLCIDKNREMLSNLIKHLRASDIRNFIPVEAPAGRLPIASNSMHGLFTFNAIHLFRAPRFLAEALRVLKSDGLLLIYTRLRSQNRRNIWGRYFPDFHEKEQRLYEIEELEEMVRGLPGLELESVEYYRYDRAASLDWLISQARNHHYSTFDFYGGSEFNEALGKFKENILHYFFDPTKVSWRDENVMLVIRNRI